MTNKRTIDIITDLVCGEYRTDMGRLRSRCRRRELVEPRQFIMYFTRKHTDLSFREVGEMFSQDHATAIHAENTIRDLILYNGLKARAAKLERSIVQAIYRPQKQTRTRLHYRVMFKKAHRINDKGGYHGL